jgi:hypothetical protein
VLRFGCLTGHRTYRDESWCLCAFSCAASQRCQCWTSSSSSTMRYLAEVFGPRHRSGGASAGSASPKKPSAVGAPNIVHVAWLMAAPTPTTARTRSSTRLCCDGLSSVCHATHQHISEGHAGKLAAVALWRFGTTSQAWNNESASNDNFVTLSTPYSSHRSDIHTSLILKTISTVRR